MRATLLTKAKDDLWNAELIFSHKPNDRGKLCLAGFHLQQCMEKTLKYVIECHGEDAHKTCELTFLIATAQQYLPDIGVDILPRVTVYNSWAVAARYETDFTILVHQVERAILLCKALVALADTVAPPSVVDSSV